MAAPADAGDPAGVVAGEAAVSERTRRLRWWWPVWVALLVLGFAVPQTAALVAGEPGRGFVGGTFSETLGGWLGTSDGAVTAGWIVFTLLVMLGAVWWTVHARRGWWWERPDDDDGGG